MCCLLIFSLRFRPRSFGKLFCFFFRWRTGIWHDMVSLLLNTCSFILYDDNYYYVNESMTDICRNIMIMGRNANKILIGCRIYFEWFEKFLSFSCKFMWIVKCVQVSVKKINAIFNYNYSINKLIYNWFLIKCKTYLQRISRLNTIRCNIDSNSVSVTISI